MLVIIIILLIILVLLMTGSLFSLIKMLSWKEKSLAIQKDLEFYQNELTALTHIQTEYQQQLISIATKDQKIQNLEERLETQKQDFENLKQNMKNEFKNISHELLNDQREKFKLQSEDSITSITKPLRENITELKDKVHKYDENLLLKTTSLQQELEKQTQTTAVLVNTFKKDKQQQGSWGEQQLELILQTSGLIKGQNYQTQVSVKKETATQLIDAIIFLPDEKHLIIDSKVSFINYHNMVNEKEIIDKEKYKKQFLQDIKNQITNLASKEYYQSLKDNKDIKSPEFVFMFMPLESSFIFILQEDPTIHSYAFDNKVVLCSPTTLFGYLKTVSSLWAMAIQNKNTKEIYDLSYKLLGKIEKFHSHIENLKSNLNTTYKTLEKVELSFSGRQGILLESKKLDTLGIKNSLAEKIKEPIEIEELGKKQKLLELKNNALFKEESNE